MEMDSVFACDNIGDGGPCRGGLLCRLGCGLRSRHFDCEYNGRLVDDSGHAY